MIIDSPIVSGSYAASGSFNQSGDVVISGSLTVTGSIIGTSSFALTASYANNAGAGAGFPFSGSAQITGSLLITELSGSGVRYVVTDATGLLSAQTASAVIKTTQAYTATGGQTTFAVTNGYSTGYVDVFVNGTKLNSTEFTDTSGTDVILATGSFADDVVEVVKYLPASGVSNNVLRQQTTFTASASQTVFSASYTPGLLDIFYNGSKLSPDDFTANNGTYFTLATASAANDIVDVFVYSYQVGAFSGIGGAGVANQLAYYSTSNSITGSPNFTVSGSAIVITGSLIVSSSSTFTNIGPTVLSGSVGVSGSLAVGGVEVVLVNQTSSLSVSTASFAATASSADNFLARGTITAQTLVVQTITSSIDFVTGSTQFGSRNSDIHTYTGSLAISGSSTTALAVNTNALFVSASGQVGIGTTNPRPKFHVVGLTGGAIPGATGIPSLGFANSSSIAVFTNNDTNYGTLFGTLNTGVGWIQQQRVDGTGTAYNLLLQPNSGNVGIGTTSPTDSIIGSGTFLDIAGTGGGALKLHFTNATAYGEFSLYKGSNGSFIDSAGAATAANNDLIFRTGNTNSSYSVSERMRITSGGNVGIGVTTLVSPGGSRRLLQISSGSNGAQIALGSSTSESVNPRIFSGQYDLGFAAGVTTGIIQFYTNDTERMRIVASGSVGIGVTPSAWGVSTPALQVAGYGSVSTTGGIDTQISNNAYYDGSNWRYIASQEAANYYMNRDTHVWRYKSAGTAGATITWNEAMRITSDGKLLIGTGSAGYGLFNDQRVTIKPTNDGIVVAPLGQNYSAFTVQSNNDTGTRYALYIANAASTEVGKISYTSTATTYSTTSDYRLKHDFKDFNGLNLISKIKPYDFAWNTDDSRMYGVIAHELQEVLPYAVVEEKDGERMQGVDYGKLTPVLVKAIQELKSQNDNLQSQINELKNKQQ